MQLWHFRDLFELFLLKGRGGGLATEACPHLRRPRSHKSIRMPALSLCNAAIRTNSISDCEGEKLLRNLLPSSFDDAEAAWSVGGSALDEEEEEKHLAINLMVHTHI